MSKYYAQKLSGKRLEKCYEVAPDSVKQYLNAEIDFVCNKILDNADVLELGCGYGRIFPGLHAKTNSIVGIDNSYSSLHYGKNNYSSGKQSYFAQMDAGVLGFYDSVFDVVLCLQNGLSAFRVNREKLINEALRVTKSGGIVFFSTYSEKFWDHRLEWFKIQSAHDLIGEIDYNQTGDGVIVCKDGFKAVTISAGEFDDLSSSLNLKSDITAVDESSLFWIIYVD